MKVTIENQQKRKIFKRWIVRQLLFLLDKEKIISDELIVHFVDKKTILHLHKKFFNDASITDVITFPIDPLIAKNNEEHHILGEIFICPDVAYAYAKKHKIPYVEELSLYVVHGLLHLLGYDDILTKDRIIMRKKEKKCMTLFRKMQLLPV